MRLLKSCSSLLALLAPLFLSAVAFAQTASPPSSGVPLEQWTVGGAIGVFAISQLVGLVKWVLDRRDKVASPAPVASSPLDSNAVGEAIARAVSAKLRQTPATGLDAAQVEAFQRLNAALDRFGLDVRGLARSVDDRGLACSTVVGRLERLADIGKGNA